MSARILIATRRGSLFLLYECNGTEDRIAVQAQSAQGLQDYANVMFPAGTLIQWCIMGDQQPKWMTSTLLERVA